MIRLTLRKRDNTTGFSNIVHTALTTQGRFLVRVCTAALFPSLERACELLREGQLATQR